MKYQKGVYLILLAIATTASGCGTERAVAPSNQGLGVSREPPFANARTLRARDVANIRAALAALKQSETSGVTGGPQIEETARRLQEGLAKVEAIPDATLQSIIDGDPQDPPACYTANGNLDKCFFEAYHTTRIDGTGHVFQLTGVWGSQSAVIGILVDGTLLMRSMPTGRSTSSSSLAADYDFPAPDCNPSSHTVSSGATHSVSATLAALGGLSFNANGSTTSNSAEVRCEKKGLDVTIGSQTLDLGGQTTIEVSNLNECTAPSVVASTPNIVTLADAGNGHFTATGEATGTTTISATCGTQYGTGSITVVYPTCSDPNASNFGKREPCAPAEPPPDDAGGSPIGTEDPASPTDDAYNPPGGDATGCYTTYEWKDVSYFDKETKTMRIINKWSPVEVCP